MNVVVRPSDILLEWLEHPAEMVRDLFSIEPYEWQVRVLEDFPHHPRQALAAAKGVGKTAVLAWLAWNFLLTRGPECKAKAVSVTGKNLKDNFWAEMAVWLNRSPVLSDQFTWGSERISHKRFPDTWFMAAASFQASANVQELGTTLAGLWAPHVLFLLDEAGEIPVPIVRTAEAALQRDGTEGHILVAGNTTSREGTLYDCVILHRTMWKTYEVTGDPDDPQRSPVINLEKAREQIRIHGRDNPWIQINLLAKFPAAGLNQLVSADIVRACIGRHIHLKAYDWAPRIFGGDVALFGDDLSVGFPRQGLTAFVPLVLRQQDPLQVAGHWMDYCQKWGADSVQIDATGGYGAGTIAAMRSFGASVSEVQFAGKPRDPKFFNVRSEITWLLAEWFKTEPSIPECPEIVEEISRVQYSYKGDKILIEPKEMLKARIGRSPDHMDALACTFAYPVAPRSETMRQMFAFDVNANVSKSKCDYDPISRD